jgi:hypothetical protein
VVPSGRFGRLARVELGGADALPLVSAIKGLAREIDQACAHAQRWAGLQLNRHVKQHVAHAGAAAAPVHRAASRMRYAAWHVATVAPCDGDRASVQRLERLSLADYDVLDPSDGSFDAEFAALQEQVPTCLPRRMCVEPGGARSRPRR